MDLTATIHMGVTSSLGCRCVRGFELLLLSRVSSIDHMRLRPCGIRKKNTDASRNTMRTTTALDSGRLNDLTRYAASWSGTLCHASSTCATKEKGSNKKGLNCRSLLPFLSSLPRLLLTSFLSPIHQRLIHFAPRQGAQ